MYCPFCRNPDSRVVDSRMADDGSAIRRRRQCPECGRRFTTVETTSLSVIKRSGVGEPFSRSKVINGVRKACQGRPVSEDDLAMLAQEVEENIRASGAAEIDAHEVAWSSSGPCRSWTRWRTFVSPACTRPLNRWKTSSPPSRCCATRPKSKPSGLKARAPRRASSKLRWRQRRGSRSRHRLQ